MKPSRQNGWQHGPPNKTPTFSLTGKAGTFGPMAGKKQTDATQNLREDDPVQVLPKGTKTGLPTRRQVFDALGKLAKKPRS